MVCLSESESESEVSDFDDEYEGTNLAQVGAEAMGPRRPKPKRARRSKPARVLSKKSAAKQRMAGIKATRNKKIREIKSRGAKIRTNRKNAMMKRRRAVQARRQAYLRRIRNQRQAAARKRQIALQQRRRLV